MGRFVVSKPDDGVGPRLAALNLKLETARNRLRFRDPETAALMNDLSEQARETVADVRRSVHALRPPALDELGLLAALREGAAQYGHDGLRVAVEAPRELPPLPAAVEVACCRIAFEAMTNVVRHAGASNCWVRLGLEEQAGILRLEVEDDGRGYRRRARRRGKPELDAREGGRTGGRLEREDHARRRHPR